MNYQLELITYLNKIYDKKIQDILQKENLNKLMKLDRKSTRLNSSHDRQSRMPSSA